MAIKLNIKRSWDKEMVKPVELTSTERIPTQRRRPGARPRPSKLAFAAPKISTADKLKARKRITLENLTYTIWETMRMEGQTKPYLILEEPSATVNIANLNFNPKVEKAELSLMVNSRSIIGGSTYTDGIMFNPSTKRKGKMFVPTRNSVLIALYKILVCSPFEDKFEVEVGKYTIDFNRFSLNALKVAIRYLKEVDTKNGRAWLAPLIELLVTQEELAAFQKAKDKKKRLAKLQDRDFESPYNVAAPVRFDDDDEGDFDDDEDDEILNEIMEGPLPELREEPQLARMNPRHDPIAQAIFDMGAMKARVAGIKGTAEE